MGFYGGFPPGRPPVPEPNSGQGPAPPILPRMRPPIRPTLAAPTLTAPGAPPVLGSRPPVPGTPMPGTRPPVPGMPPNAGGNAGHPFEHPPDVNFAARKARKRAMGGPMGGDPVDVPPAPSAGRVIRNRPVIGDGEPEIEKAMRRKREML